jgi:two-component system nitrate/nitrite response regulator NarL
MMFRSPPRMLAEPLLNVSRGPTRVLIALDSPMDCQLLVTASRRSRQQLSIVAWAVSKADILHCFLQGNIDVALINADLEDGRMAGFDILTEIHTSYPRTPTVMLFDSWNDDLVVHAFRAGAKGVFCRTEKNLDMLWKCIAVVHEGQVWANSGQIHLLLNTLRKATSIREATSPGLKLLTTRETHVANLVAEGLPNKEVALRLGLTEHTVSNYLFRTYNKLGISSRVELVLYVMKGRELSPVLASGQSEARAKRECTLVLQE